MRELIPHGHTLTEFLMARYGRPMYGLALFIMLFYLFIALSAEVTAIAKLVTMLAPVPLWATAAIVMGTTLLYTTYGGLRSSIFTDQVQMMVIVPLLVILCVVGWQAVGGAMPTIEALQAKAPQLLDLTDPVGIKAGLTFFVAILLTGIFHQGNWQRIYAARDARSMRNGFLLGGLLVAPFIFLMGLFGLAFVGLAPQGDSSIALFSVIMPHAPAWFVIALIPLGLSLVMSTADTAISAVSSIIAVDMRRLMPNASSMTMKRLARWLVLLMAIPVMIVPRRATACCTCSCWPTCCAPPPPFRCSMDCSAASTTASPPLSRPSPAWRRACSTSRRRATSPRSCWSPSCWRRWCRW